MAAIRIEIDDKTVYEGSGVGVPRVGDDIRHDGEVLRISAVVWDFAAAGSARVTLVVGDRPYTY